METNIDSITNLLIKVITKDSSILTLILKVKLQPKNTILELLLPSNKKKIQEFFSMQNFVSKYVYKTQLNLRPFYNILRLLNNFEWTLEHQKRSDETKTLLTEQISDTIIDPDPLLLRSSITIMQK